MANSYKSKYTGEQIDAILDIALHGALYAFVKEFTISDWEDNKIHIRQGEHCVSAPTPSLFMLNNDLYEEVVGGIAIDSENAVIIQSDLPFAGKIIIKNAEKTDSSLFDFYICDTNDKKLYFVAEKGMTWEQFIDSEYNTGTTLIKKYSIGSSTYLTINNSNTYAIGTRLIGSTTLERGVNLTDIIVEPNDIREYYLYPTPSCLVAGTQILVSLNGDTKSIEELASGDTIVSYNIKTGENYLAKVTRVVINENSVNMTKVTFANGVMLNMTTIHPVLTRNGFCAVCAWADYSELAVGDEAKTVDGWSAVTKIEQYTLDDPVRTYTLGVVDYNENPDVDIYDNFYANGIVVHNKFS